MAQAHSRLQRMHRIARGEAPAGSLRGMSRSHSRLAQDSPQDQGAVRASRGVARQKAREICAALGETRKRGADSRPLWCRADRCGAWSAGPAAGRSTDPLAADTSTRPLLSGVVSGNTGPRVASSAFAEEQRQRGTGMRHRATTTWR